MKDSNKLIYKSGNIDDVFIDKHLLLMIRGPITSLLLALTIVPGIICLILVCRVDLESITVKHDLIRLFIVSLVWTLGAMGCINRLHKLFGALHNDNSVIIISRFNEDGINTKGFVKVSIAGVRGKLWCTSNGIIDAYRGVPVVVLITGMTNNEISNLIHSHRGIPKKNVVSIYLGAKYTGKDRDIGLVL